MTSERRFGIDCYECGERNIQCPNCNTLLRQDTKYSLWLRNLPYPFNGRLCSAQNLDYVWLRFYDNWFITMEEKTNSKEYNLNNRSDLSQIQSHGLLNQMLTFASGNEFDISFGTTKRIERVTYNGHYLIIFEKTNPDDSDWIKINGKEHTREDLLHLLENGYLVSFTELKEMMANNNGLPLSAVIAKWQQG